MHWMNHHTSNNNTQTTRHGQRGEFPSDDPGIETPQTWVFVAARSCDCAFVLFFNSIGGKQTAHTIRSILGRALSHRSTAGASLPSGKFRWDHKSTSRCERAHTHKRHSWKTVRTNILDPLFGRSQITQKTFHYLCLCHRTVKLSVTLQPCGKILSPHLQWYRYERNLDKSGRLTAFLWSLPDRLLHYLILIKSFWITNNRAGEEFTTYSTICPHNSPADQMLL